MGWGEDLFEALLMGLAFKLATRNMTAEEIDRFFRSAPPALPPPRPVYRLLQPPQLPAPAANLGPPAVPDAPKNPMAVEGSWKEFQARWRNSTRQRNRRRQKEKSNRSSLPTPHRPGCVA